MSATPIPPTVDGPIHEYFELTYSTHLVLPRVLLQSMPEEWQERMVALLREYDDAFAHIETPQYQVTPCRWVAAEDLTEAEAKAAGITSSLDDLRLPALPENPTEAQFEAHEAAWETAHAEKTFHDAVGNELDPQERVAVPARDPLPHYRHGYVQPHDDCPDADGGGHA